MGRKKIINHFCDRYGMYAYQGDLIDWQDLHANPREPGAMQKGCPGPTATRTRAGPARRADEWIFASGC